MSPSEKQNSTYAVYVATYWSCWIRKSLRIGRPWNIIYWWMEKIRYYLQGCILGQEKQSSLKVPGHSILKASWVLIQSGGVAAVSMEQEGCLLGLLVAITNVTHRKPVTAPVSAAARSPAAQHFQRLMWRNRGPETHYPFDFPEQAQDTDSLPWVFLSIETVTYCNHDFFLRNCIRLEKETLI